MLLYYYTGKGTYLDLQYARKLNLAENELCELVNEIKISESIRYINIKLLNRPSENQKNYWFTHVAMKPFIKG